MDEDSWACIVYDHGARVGIPNYTMINRTYVVFGDHTEHSSVLVDTGIVQDYQTAGQNSNSGFSLQQREGGGLIASWIEHFTLSDQVREDVSGPSVSLITSDGAQDSFRYLGDFSTQNPIGNRAIFYSTSPDSVLGTWAGDSGQAFFWDDRSASAQPSVSWSCEPEAIIEFGMTRWGNYIPLFLDNSSPPRVHAARYEIDDENNLTCADEIVLDILDGTVYSRLVATVWHPDYGYAILSTRRHEFMLSRIDTTLQEVQPLGVFHEFDTHAFWGGDIAIADDGEVVLLYPKSVDGHTRLYIELVGWDTFLSVDDPQPAAIPSELSLSAYPNPFNGTVKLSYELATAGDVTLSIFNLSGQKVATLVDEHSTAGSYETNWSPQIASGVYFAQLETQHLCKTEKLLYLR